MAEEVWKMLLNEITFPMKTHATYVSYFIICVLPKSRRSCFEGGFPCDVPNCKASRRRRLIVRSWHTSGPLQFLLGNHPAIGFREFHNAAFHIYTSNGFMVLC